MSERKLRFLFALALAVCMVFFSGCSDKAPPADDAAASTAWTSAPTDGLVPWGETLHFAVSADAENARVTKAMVNRVGQALTAEYDVEMGSAGTFVHTPFGGVFNAPQNEDTVYIRYRRTQDGADTAEESIVCSVLPTLTNSNLEEVLKTAMENGDAVQPLPTVSLRTGDGKAETAALWVTDDGIPFLTADEHIVLCLRTCDPDNYAGAEMRTLDLGDGRDAIVIVWGHLWNLDLQCAVQDADGWHELQLPKPKVTATLTAPYRIDFTLPDGQAISLDARAYAALADCFDTDGMPYRESGSIVFRVDSPYEIVVLHGHTALRFIGYPILCARGADGDGEYDFAALPMTLYIQSGALCYAYGALTAE